MPKVKQTLFFNPKFFADPNSIDPTSVDFSPHAYLAVYYPDASYQDLQKGMQRLQASLEQNTEFLRTLVRNNLDRFMNSKEAIDAFYHELKDQELIGDAAGSRALRSTIKCKVTLFIHCLNAVFFFPSV